MSRVVSRFAWVETRWRAGSLVAGLMSELSRKNCWMIAEHVGDATLHGTAFRTSVARLVTDVVRDDRTMAGRTVCSYLLHCERSSGQYLFDALLDPGSEYGIDIDGGEAPGT